MSGALASREQCPAIPYTPAEYAAEARRVVDEGGVMVHLHARTPDGRPSHEIEDFRAITEAIRAEVGDAVIVNYSTGALGVPVEKRLAYLRELVPEIGALNMGSMNYAKYSARRKDFVFAAVFENSFETIRALLDGMVEAGIRPEHECFDSGHVASLDPLLDMGVLKPPLQVSFVMGVTGGIRPTARNVAHMAEQVPDVPHQWGVIGISRAQWGLLAAALSLGGNVRVGLEDNFYLPDGEMARSNGELVARAARMADGRGAAAGDGRRGAIDVGPLVSALDGLRVLDLTRLLPGGYCTLLLADHGADVVKVEDTGAGDYARADPPAFASLNRGKRSIQLDLKADGGRAALLRLVRDADVLIESFRPGVMDRLGVGFETLRAVNPRSSTARSPATGRTGRCAPAPATTSTTSRARACSR